MVMLAVYFDESGTGDTSPVLSVGGYVATVDKWRRFDREWRHFLDEEKIGFLHMTDLENFQKQFSGFGPNDKKRLLQRAHYLIQSTGAVGIAGSVCRKEFKDIVIPDKYAFGKIGSSYCLAAQTAMLKVGMWARSTGHTDPIRYVFANLQSTVDGIKVKGELINLLDDFKVKAKTRERLFLGDYSFEEMKDIRPLQAADIHAYEVTKYLHRTIGVTDRPHRKSMAHLMRAVAHDGGYWDGENLSALVELVKHPPSEEGLKWRKNATSSTGR
jgi:hypothetical protein